MSDSIKHQVLASYNLPSLGQDQALKTHLLRNTRLFCTYHKVPLVLKTGDLSNDSLVWTHFKDFFFTFIFGFAVFCTRCIAEW